MLHTLKLLLPALIPSWRFFDEITPSPRIEYALLENAQDTPDHWREFRPRPETLSFVDMLRRMFFNPRWNESLFLVSCAERLTMQPTEHTRREIVQRIMMEVGKGNYMQFRLAFVGRSDTGMQRQITYTSPVYPHDT